MADALGLESILPNQVLVIDESLYRGEKHE